METSVPRSAVRGSKIWIDRNKLLKNTIYVNPRMLKASSTNVMRKEINSVNVPQAYMDIHRPLSGISEHNEMNEQFTAAKCVYLNPHFQRTAPNSVHINPKKLSQVMQCSKEMLIKNHPHISKQDLKISEACKSDISSCHAFSTKPSKCSQHETSTTGNTSYVSSPPSSNKKLDNLATDRCINTGQLRNNLVMKKNGSYKLVRISDTKLVRTPDRSKSWCVNKALQKTLINQTCQMIKKCHEVQDGKNVKKKSEKQKRLYADLQYHFFPPLAMNKPTQYRLNQKILPAVQNKGRSNLHTSAVSSPSKYKIDRRLVKSKLLKKVAPRLESTGSSLQRRNVGVKGFYISPVLHRTRNSSLSRRIRFSDGKKIVISSRKLLRIGSNMKTRKPRREKDQSSHSTRLIRIGGVLYKTSRTKLMRSKTESSTKQPVAKRRKTDRSRTIYIRGNKFIMDAMGKTLKQVPENKNDNCMNQSKSLPVKRVDIGGITFIQKSSDLLVRTNTHRARNIVNHAKNKSIAMLTNKLRKINQPCAFYRRFGKCPRKDKGMCQLVHDPKQVAVCKRFLQGECNIDNCLLSHQIVPEKMPTCKYFLEGCCVRENCPYLHVKLNSKAVICEKFLQGYCAEGPRCKKRHSYVCPEYEKLGTCQKGKYCPYPHKTSLKYSKKTVLNQVKPNHPPGDLQRKRYYQEDKSEDQYLGISEEEISQKTQIFQQTEKSLCCQPQQKWAESASHQEEPSLKRPKIGRLPSFIALGH